MRALPLLLLLPACTRVTTAEVEPAPPRAFTISVWPETMVVRTGPSGAAPIQFNAVATYEDGEVEDLEVVDWELSNGSIGELDSSGVFTANATNGGVSWVHATLDGVVGTADLTTIYTEQWFVDDVSPDLFDRPVVEVTGSWLYPPDGVNVPRNTPALHFQWADYDADAYRLQFQSATTEIEVYVAAREWIATTDEWNTIASTNAGGDVAVGLAAAVAGEVWEEPDITLRVNRMDADGAIIYWSTSNAGFIEIPYGGDAEEFYTQDQVGRCVGCHALSNDGKMAFTYDGGDGNLGVIWIDDQSDFIPDAQGAKGNFKTFSPDSRFLLATSGGNVSLFDAQTGDFLSTVLADSNATHVDWSPDDTRIAFTLSDGHGADWSLGGTSRIAVMDHLGDGEFANLRVVVEPKVNWKAYYPAWSPDGEWIAYNLSFGDTYDDPDATVWVVDGDGKLPPVPLSAANDVGELTNSWPRWGPLPDDDVLWLAFASRRPYGYITVSQPQIWVAAFDPAKMTTEEDPSWPAFWLPGQDTATANHLPLWVR